MTNHSAERDLAALLRPTTRVLFDFDGPVCAVFAEVGDKPVAAHLRAALNAAGYPIEGADGLGPHGVLAYAATLDQAAANLVEAELSAAELGAVKTATPTPGTSDFLAACTETRRPVVIVSNTNAEAIAAYLGWHGLRQYVAHIEGRDGDARRMKPGPWVIRRALKHTGVGPSEAVLIGDSATDIEAAHTAEVRVVGYADKLGKAARLRVADAVVSDMHRLAHAIRAGGTPA